MSHGTGRHSWRYYLARWVIFAGVIGGMCYGIVVFLGTLYHGPETMGGVAVVMPGVPIFPVSSLAPANRGAQRAMALPLWFIRRQGATHAETALLQAPADQEFILEWYQQAARPQGWSLVGHDGVVGGRRLVFLRGREGLQVTVGATADIFTPVQLIYMDGLTTRQVAQLAPAGPLDNEPGPIFARAPKPKPAAPKLAPAATVVAANAASSATATVMAAKPSAMKPYPVAYVPLPEHFFPSPPPPPAPPPLPAWHYPDVPLPPEPTPVEEPPLPEPPPAPVVAPPPEVTPELPVIVKPDTAEKWHRRTPPPPAPSPAPEPAYPAPEAPIVPPNPG